MDDATEISIINSPSINFRPREGQSGFFVIWVFSLWESCLDMIPASVKPSGSTRGISPSMKPLHGGMNESLLSCAFSTSEILVMKISLLFAHIRLRINFSY